MHPSFNNIFIIFLGGAREGVTLEDVPGEDDLLDSDVPSTGGKSKPMKYRVGSLHLKLNMYICIKKCDYI